MPFTTRQLRDALGACSRQLPHGHRRYWLAFSGGMDSHVLLHALAQLAGQDDMELRAVHVNHGLQASATDWVSHCQRVCEQLAVPLTVLDVDAGHAPGESPEASARAARYAAFASLLGDGDILLTAQHCRDQAETLLLQLLRGAGPRGLSAMPSLGRLGKGYLCRPLLAVPHSELQDYAIAQQLAWIDDPSNLDTSFDRNFLRHAVMPGLRERWPSLDTTLARVAGQQAEAEQLLAELAAQDRQDLAGPGNSLALDGLAALSPARQRNVLRDWLAGQGMTLPSARKLEQLQHDMCNAAPDRNPVVGWGGCEVRRYRGRLYTMAPLPVVDPATRLAWQPGQPLEVPGLGRLVSRPVTGAGLAVTPTMPQAELRFRHGGEDCQPAGKAHHASLKKLFQQAGIPPWQRERTPLLYIDNRLAAIPGLCICEPFAARDGMPGFELEWQAFAASD